MPLTWQPTPTAAILNVQIAEWDGTAQVWRDVSTYLDPVDLKLTWMLDGFTAEGSLRLQVPLAEDIFAFDAWNEVRIASTTANNPVGGYSRYFRGFINRYTSTTDTEALLKVYNFTLIGPGTLLDIPTATFVGLRTYQGTDQEIIHALAAYALPELYPSGITNPTAIPSTPTTSLYSAGSSLAAGTYTLAIAWANPVGAGVAGKKSVTLTAGQGVHVTIPAFPTGVTQAVVYMSRAVGDSHMLEHGRAYAPGTYNITSLGTGAADNLTNQMGPYPTVPADQPVNNYSTVQTPTYGRLMVDVENMTLREALVAVQKAVPADYEVPAFTLLWQWDNSAHTADWRFQLMWLRDSDRPVSSVVLNDAGVESNVHANYYGYSRVRDGQAVRNVQPVLGAWIGASGRQAQSTTTSSVSYTQIGRYLAAKPIVDTSLTADSDCAARGRQEIDKIKLVAETISQVATLVPYFTIGTQLGCNRLQIRRTTEGAMDAVLDANLPTYVIGRVDLSFDADGIPGYILDLGTSFAELGERPSGFRGGTTTTQDHIPPPVPDWYGDSRDVVSNVYSGATHSVTLAVTWAPDTTSQDLSYYETALSLDGGTTWRDPVRSEASGSPLATYAGLPYTDPTTGAAPAATLRLRATDTHGNTSDWGTARAAIALATRDIPAAPVWVAGYSTAVTAPGLGSATLTWTDGGGGTGTLAQWRVYWAPSAGGTGGVITGLTSRAVTIPGLAVATNYTVTVQAGTTYNDWGTLSSTKTITIAADSPGPPATVTVTGTRTGPNTGQANLSWTAGTGGTGTAATYEARYYVTASGASTAVIVPVATDNRVLTIPGLPVGTQYTFNVRSITAYGDRGPWSTSAPTLTLAAQAPPAPTGLTVLDYDPGQTGQSAWILLGWTAGVGGTGTVATYNVRVDWTESSTGVVRKWHRDGIPATDTSTLLSPLTAGPSYTITMWGITAWGDSSSSASTTYGITPKPVAALYNGDFEIADPSNLARPDGWAVTLGGGHTAALDTGQASSGLQSVKLTAGGSTGNTTTLTSRKFRIPANVQFVLRYTRRSDEASPTSTVGGSVDYYNLAGSSVSSQAIIGTAPAAGSTWETVTIGVGSGSLTTPVAYVQISLAVTMAQASKHLWLDAVTFTQRVVTDDYTDASVTTAKFAAGAVDSAALGTAAINSITKFSSALAPIQKGTSNPGSPSSGDTVFRSDQGRLGYYDGTRWLSLTPTAINFVLSGGNVTPFPNTLGPGTTVYAAAKAQNLDWWLDRLDLAVNVQTTNNASNYWTITLLGVNAGGTSTLATVNTSALTVGTWAALSLTAFLGNPYSATAYSWFAIQLTKTATPGSIYLYPQLLIRDVLP